jgi:hypothetical protein
MRRTEAPLKVGVGLPKMNGKEFTKQLILRPDENRSS